MTHASYIANNPNLRVTSKGNIDQDFGPYYQLHNPDDPLENLEFYLKYDVEGFFRCPDLTDQCIYLAHVIHDTIK